MQTSIIFSIIVSLIYFILSLTMNRFIEDKKTLKMIATDSCMVFISTFVGSYAVDVLGLASVVVKQKGGNTVAFTTKPEF